MMLHLRNTFLGIALFVALTGAASGFSMAVRARVLAPSEVTAAVKASDATLRHVSRAKEAVPEIPATAPQLSPSQPVPAEHMPAEPRALPHEHRMRPMPIDEHPGRPAQNEKTPPAESRNLDATTMPAEMPRSHHERMPGPDRMERVPGSRMDKNNGRQGPQDQDRQHRREEFRQRHENERRRDRDGQRSPMNRRGPL